MKKKVIEIISLVILFSILSLGNLSTICKIYPALGSDNQALLFWKYAAGTGLLVYKDIFYPYGLLPYYQDQNIFFALFYFLLTPVLLSIIFLIFKYLFKDKLFSITTIIIFYLFIVTLTGFEVFTRYGSLAAAAMVFAYLFYKNKTKKIFFGSGIVVGLLFALLNDLGIYALLLFVVMAVIDMLIKAGWRVKLSHLLRILKTVGVFVLGFSFGLLPFVVYLFTTNSLFEFIFYLRYLGEIAQFAKTPFFHAIVSTDNIFALSMLITTLFFLSFKLFYTKSKVTFNNYLQIGLVLVLLLFEQKSIIRMIDTLISFIGLLLFFCLFYECFNCDCFYFWS
jgi:hypothetical protein